MRSEEGAWARGAVLIALLSTATEVYAQGCEPRVATLVSAQGAVEIERLGQPRWQAVAGDDPLCPGDRVRVGPLGRAAVRLADEAETQVRLDEQTILSFPAPQAEKSLLLKLIEGVLHVLSRVPHALTIETPLISAGVEGTEFVLGVSKREAELWVFEGRVRYWNAQGQLQVGSGEGALARPGQAPVRRVLVKPRKAVEWALYYPPLVDPRPEAYPPALRGAVSAYRGNDLPGAFALLERIPAAERDGRYHLLRAGMLLGVGRVPRAEADLREAERADPKGGGAPALRSVIALVRDQKDQALRLAEEGAGRDPSSPLPQAALSYAHQGLFEIEKALEHARRAVELAPEDALLWARVSELELSRGDLDAALEAAEKAEALSPALPRTQTVLGYAYLTRIEVDKAKSAFERAIRGDPADPLPRLGLGLAKIRDGDLEAGRRDIETAASLDPDNSLVRSYLGKAYYEEKRDGLAAGEYERAKLLDPKDPTPWLYDAIRKQTTNQPVEALHDLQKAIELNDNRAVYRSKLLLDQDLAARSSALGRVYRDLGFEQRALVEGWKSVNTDPSDYSGHRLLADTYSARPLHEVARVSELLQSQLLQPLNITPVQANLSENELLILDGGGPSQPAFNEYNPLFLRDRFALQASGVLGSRDTTGDEVTQSGIWGKFSYSLSQFHFETDGFRNNNELRQDLYNVFAQYALSPNLTFLGEIRHRETHHGDLEFEFEPEVFDPDFDRYERVDLNRFGLRYSPTVHSNVIAVVSHYDVREDTVFTRILDRPLRDSKFSSDGYVAEGQFSFRSDYVDLILGVGAYYFGSDVLDRDVDLLTGQREDGQLTTQFNTEHEYGYVYTYWRFPTTLTWTLGGSFDSLNDGRLGQFDKLNPKLGLVWEITPSTILRLSYSKNLKRVPVNYQTVEPTQVAGFNQFFDDPNATESRRYGVAFDQKFSDDLYGGLEFSKRDLKVPQTEGTEPGLASLRTWEEDTFRAYIHWTPHPQWAASLQYEQENFNEEDEFSIIPSTNTRIVPGTLAYFHPSGVFARLRLTYVDQGVEVGDERERDEHEGFLLTDVGFGYRLPKRLGIVNIEVRNLFDKDFEFQDLNLRTETGEAPRFVPELTVFGQVTIAF